MVVSDGEPETYNARSHWWGMLIDVDKCIGCGNCVRACAAENKVPDGFYRTWIERYEVPAGEDEAPHVESPDGGPWASSNTMATTL